jgi:integrase
VSRPNRIPSYRLHKPTGQAIVAIRGKMFYLGPYGSVESRAEYNRIIAEWLAQGSAALSSQAQSGPDAGSDLRIAELILAYWEHAQSYYTKNGEATSEVGMIKLAVRPLHRLYGGTAAKDFGPLALKTVRQEFIEADLCRNEINRRVRLIVRMFKWAVSNEMVPPSVHQGLKAVEGLKKGRCEVRESSPVKPVPDRFVDAIHPHVSRQVWTMIELQRLSGMRPGEVCSMRTIDVDRSGRVWLYTPSSHKTEHHGRERKIYIGPQAQAVLRPWLRTGLTDCLFQPREAVAERRAEQRRNRKTPVQPSQQDRRKRAPKKVPRERYTSLTYCQAITRAIARANQEAERTGGSKIPHWHPNQLRHNAATRLRREFGLEIAKAVLGHTSVMPTQIYAEQDQAAAAEAMLKIG